MDDETIKKFLVDELYWDAKIDASDIKAQVDNGQVKLEGSVPTYSTKLAASRDAWNIIGVRSVKNDLDVKYKITAPSDRDIENTVRSKLVWDPYVDASKIDVDVKNGVVTLSGSVDAYWRKVTAETQAENTLGVIDVINNIGIAPTRNYNDEEISKELSNTLSRKITVLDDAINVNVKDGKVMLTGTVPNWYSSYQARRAAERTLGVRAVENDLVIRS